MPTQLINGGLEHTSAWVTVFTCTGGLPDDLGSLAVDLSLGLYGLALPALTMGHSGSPRQCPSCLQSAHLLDFFLSSGVLSFTLESPDVDALAEVCVP